MLPEVDKYGRKLGVNRGCVSIVRRMFGRKQLLENGTGKHAQENATFLIKMYTRKCMSCYATSRTCVSLCLLGLANTSERVILIYNVYVTLLQFSVGQT